VRALQATRGSVVPIDPPHGATDPEAPSLATESAPAYTPHVPRYRVTFTKGAEQASVNVTADSEDEAADTAIEHPEPVPERFFEGYYDPPTVVKISDA
jgi:hypothetical protein